MKLDPNAPAYPTQFPIEIADGDGNTIDVDRNHPDGYEPGLTIRAELAARFAAAWAQAIAVRAHEQPDYIDDCATIEANRLGLLQADALIAELNRDAVTESEATR